MNETVDFIRAMLDMAGFESFEHWLRLMDINENKFVQASLGLWTMNCWQMADEGFTFPQVLEAVDHMLINIK